MRCLFKRFPLAARVAGKSLLPEHSQGKRVYFINVPLVQLLARGEK